MTDQEAQQQALQAADEMAGRLELFAAHVRQPFTSFESFCLRHTRADIRATVVDSTPLGPGQSIADIEQLADRRIADATAKATGLAQQAMATDMRLGMLAVELQSGARVPEWWQQRTAIACRTDPQWQIVMAMHAAQPGMQALRNSNRPASTSSRPVVVWSVIVGIVATCLIASAWYNAQTTPADVPPSQDVQQQQAPIPPVDVGGHDVNCADGTVSHSGGKQGACSWHGGVGG